MSASTSRARTASQCSVAATPSSVCVSRGGGRVGPPSRRARSPRRARRRRDPTSDRIDHGDGIVAARRRPPPHEQRDHGERGRGGEVAPRPPTPQQAAPHGLVGDEPVEPAPPRAADVDGEVAGRDRPLGRVAGEHVLEHETLVGEQRITLERGGRRADPGEFVLLVGREDAQPPAGGQIDHRGPEAGGGQRGVVRQHVDDAGRLAAEGAGAFGAARGRGGATRCSTMARATKPAMTMSAAEHEEHRRRCRGEHHQR